MIIKKLLIPNILGFTLYATYDENSNEGLMINNQNQIYNFLHFQEDNDKMMYIFEKNISLSIQKIIYQHIHSFHIIFRYEGKDYSKQISYQEFTQSYKINYFPTHDKEVYFNKLSKLLTK